MRNTHGKNKHRFVGVGEVDAVIEVVIDVETGNSIIYVGGIGRVNQE